MSTPDFPEVYLPHCIAAHLGDLMNQIKTKSLQIQIDFNLTTSENICLAGYRCRLFLEVNCLQTLEMTDDQGLGQIDEDLLLPEENRDKA